MKTILLIPDMHIPKHDRRATRCVIDIARDIQPDEILQLGDLIDCEAPARWSKGHAEEFAAGLDQEAEAAHRVFDNIREVYDGPISWIQGNHELRISTYLTKWAPALRGIVPSVPQLLRFDDYGITEQRQPYRLAPGAVAIHGKRMSSTQNSAGQSAYKERMRFGLSVVQGHTHRAGVAYDTQERTRFSMECGHLSDLRQASYLEFPEQANWQQAIGLLHVFKQRVYPELVLIQGGRAVVHKKTYGG